MTRRFFRHGELPLVLLALLAERPMHGYQVMAELGRLFGPAYRPSPGTVYPAVDALEAEGLIEGARNNGRTVYELTPIGSQALADREQMLAEVELRTGARLHPDHSLDPVIARFKARIAPLEGRVDPQAVATVLEGAAREIEALDGDDPRQEA
jgi:DNA-binding PadR family transcriptional regulator